MSVAGCHPGRELGTILHLELPTGSVTKLLVLESDLRLTSYDAARLHE
jgi:hypothetical protein